MHVFIDDIWLLCLLQYLLEGMAVRTSLRIEEGSGVLCVLSILFNVA